jgi:hypothetical protein
MPPTSIDCARFSCFIAWMSLRGGITVLPPPQCAANMDVLSSIGVKILCFMEACSGFGWGRGGLWKSCCAGGDGTVIVGCGGRSCCWGGGCGVCDC